MNDKCNACYDCLNDPDKGLENPILCRMILCVKCGNKRCPHATNHNLKCVGSKESAIPIKPESNNTRNTMKDKIKKRKTYELRLTKMELVHMRDLLSIIIPSDTKKTLSQILADLEDRAPVEEKLWNKIIGVCKEASLPTGEEAPDYIVSPTAPPPMSVFQISDDDDEADEEEAHESHGFLKNEEEE